MHRLETLHQVRIFRVYIQNLIWKNIGKTTFILEAVVVVRGCFLVVIGSDLVVVGSDLVVVNSDLVVVGFDVVVVLNVVAVGAVEMGVDRGAVRFAKPNNSSMGQQQLPAAGCRPGRQGTKQSTDGHV
jgi:hypothetical protein